MINNKLRAERANHDKNSSDVIESNKSNQNSTIQIYDGKIDEKSDFNEENILSNPSSYPISKNDILTNNDKQISEIDAKPLDKLENNESKNLTYYQCYNQYPNQENQYPTQQNQYDYSNEFGQENYYKHNYNYYQKDNNQRQYYYYEYGQYNQYDNFYDGNHNNYNDYYKQNYLNNSYNLNEKHYDHNSHYYYNQSDYNLGDKSNIGNQNLYEPHIQSYDEHKYDYVDPYYREYYNKQKYNIPDDGKNFMYEQEKDFSSLSVSERNREGINMRQKM